MKQTIEELNKQFEKAISQTDVDFALLSKLSTQLHDSDEPEWKKVRIKDGWIQSAINILDRDIPKADWLPQGLARFLRLIVSALQNSEKLFEEIKDKEWPIPPGQEAPKPARPEGEKKD